MSKLFMPNGERVLIKEIKEEEKKTSTGIILSSREEHRPTFLGEVVALGNAFTPEFVKRLGIDVGDMVEVRKLMHDEIRLDDETFLCISLESIIGKYYKGVQ